MQVTRVQTIGGAVVTIEVDGVKILILSGVNASRLAAGINSVCWRFTQKEMEFVIDDEAGNPWTVQITRYATWLTSGVSTPVPPHDARKCLELSLSRALEVAKGIDVGVTG